MKRVLRPGAAATLSLGAMCMVGCAWGFGGNDDAVTDMHRHYSRAVDIQTAVVRGELDRARESGAWLANHQARSPFPEASEPYRAEMMGYAALIGQAESLRAAAIQAGHMAGACGDCHQAIGAGPRFVLHGGPPETSPSSMVRHFWAADRMWDGLVGPSEEAWKAGARALRESASSLGEAVFASQSSSVSPGLSARLVELGASAETAVSQEDRSAVYGQVLETCHRCHSTTAVLTRR